MLLFSRSVVSNSCDPRVGSPPGSSVYGISQGRILEWVATSLKLSQKLNLSLKCLHVVEVTSKSLAKSMGPKETVKRLLSPAAEVILFYFFPFFSVRLILFKNIYFIIYSAALGLSWAHRFFSCSIQTLSCGMWD